MRRVGGFWFGPAVPGLLLVLMGLLIFRYPQIVIYAVACGFIGLGVFLIVVAWRLRPTVSFHRLDEDGS
jgi:hypothetical protein